MESSLPTPIPIKRFKSLSNKEFIEFYYNKRVPVVFEGGCKHLTESPYFQFKNIAAKVSNHEEIVDTDIYSEYGTIKRSNPVNVGDYILGLDSMDFDHDRSEYKYLAIFDMFKHCEEAKNLFNETCNYFPQATCRLERSFIGPKGTLHDFHYDVYGDIMFYQVQGRKLWRICSDKDSKYLYEGDKYDLNTYLSKVAYDANEEEMKLKYPDFKFCFMYETILEPGDVLFVPHRYWHYVKSLSSSLSISCFGQQRNQIHEIYGIEKVKDYLHKFGLFKNKLCVCCETRRTIFNWPFHFLGIYH